MDSESTSPQPPGHDLSYSEALKVAQVDFARLMHLHDVSWRVDVACSTVIFFCSCDEGERNAAALAEHILKAVKEARGPVRGPKK